MVLSHEKFNEQVESFVSDVASALAAVQSSAPVVNAEYAASDSDRLRAAVDAKVELHPPAEPGDSLAELGVSYKLCVDSFSDYLAVEHSSFVLKAKVDRAPIFRWDYDRDPRSKPSSHVQITAHRGALSHLLSRLEHDTPHSMESLHLPMGGDRFRPSLEDVVEFLIRDCGFPGVDGWKAVVQRGRAKWRRIQTRVAVRDSPAEAVAALEAMGYVVQPPPDGERAERIEKLQCW
jgi:hypothetical protein